MRNIVGFFVSSALMVSSALAATGGSIEGQVLKGNERFVGGIAWLLEVTQEWKLEPLRTQSIAEDGRFTFADLPPGRYEVAVVVDEMAWVSRMLGLRHGLTARFEIPFKRPATKLPTLYDEFTREAVRRVDEVLDQVGEPALCSSSGIQPGAESYRVVWLRSFDNLVVARWDIGADNSLVGHYKEATQPSAAPPAIVEEHSLNLLERWVSEHAETLQSGADGPKSESDIEEYRTLMRGLVAQQRRDAEEAVWSEPYRVDTGRFGVDGATWIVEARREGRCHVVERWSPASNSMFRSFAWGIIKSTAGKRFYYDEVY